MLSDYLSGWLVIWGVYPIDIFAWKSDHFSHPSHFGVQCSFSRVTLSASFQGMVGTVWSFDGRRTIKQGEIRKCNIKEIKDICKDTTNPISREYMRRVDTHVNLIRRLYAGRPFNVHFDWKLFSDLERPSTYSNGKLSWTVVTDLFVRGMKQSSSKETFS